MEIKKTDSTSEAQAAKGGVRRFVGDVFDILELFVICAAVILTVFTFILRPTVVQGPSMEDTLLEGDYLIVVSAGYKPEAGDIVVAHNTALPLYHDPIVKRVIAVGGQEINIDFTTWTVTVDGQVIEEPYRKLTDGYMLTSDFTFPMTVPEGYVFVMGDNRNHSADSRTRDIGMIDERCIVGHAVLRLLPVSRFTVFD